MESGGKAYLIQNGKMQQVEWGNADGRIIPVKRGKTVPFVPGQTWINVIPSSPGLDGMITVSDGSE